jgi:hypothetical protein
METKKVGFKKIFDSFHQTSWNFVRISTVVCGSFWGGEKIQNGGQLYMDFLPNIVNLNQVDANCTMQ